MLGRMQRPVLGVLLMIGVFVGCFVGAAYARARRGWSDYQTTKKAVPVLRKAAWLLIRIATTKAGIVMLLIIAAVAYAAVGPDRPAPATTPARTGNR
jgi:hypothetical protein